MPTLRVEIESSGAAAFYAAAVRNYATDSGFDLYCPEDLVVPAGGTVFVDLGVRCQLDGGPLAVASATAPLAVASATAPLAVASATATHGYYLYPRSSLSKTPLRLANSVGIIDAGYRGTLKAAVDNRSNEDYTIKKGDRLFQICMPSLEPFAVRFAAVDRVTERGEGGMGSTGAGASMSAAAVAIARGAGLRDPNPPAFNIHYTYFT
jgi:dUTP pyrophosphatase